MDWGSFLMMTAVQNWDNFEVKFYTHGWVLTEAVSFEGAVTIKNEANDGSYLLGGD